MTDTYPFPAEAGIEPRLGDLLQDPVLHAVLARDGLCVDDVRATIAHWRNRHPEAMSRLPAAA
jgi:hypothetical protein